MRAVDLAQDHRMVVAQRRCMGFNLRYERTFDWLLDVEVGSEQKFYYKVDLQVRGINISLED